MFQSKLDECFGKIQQAIVKADVVMVVGYKQNHSDHDQTLTILLETARRCNVKLNYEKVWYKKDEIDFFMRPTQQVVKNQIKVKYQLLSYAFANQHEAGTVIHQDD